MVSKIEVSPDKIAELIGHKVQLPSLPTVSAELMSLIHFPVEKINVQQLAEIIERDQSLTAALLKLVNSPFYGRTRTVTQVSRALTLIGLSDALSYLNYTMMKNLVPPFPLMPQLSQDSYFLHSWATATAARLLGRPQYMIQSLPGELYLAGLMHDIGKVVLATNSCPGFAEALLRANNEGRPLQEVETEVMEIDHAMIGAYLLDQWNLPHAILGAIAYHHAPEDAAPEHQELAALIQLADIIANLSGIGGGGNPHPTELTDAWIHRHSQTALSHTATLETAVAEIQQELRHQAEILHYVETSPEPEPAAEVIDMSAYEAASEDAPPMIEPAPASLPECPAPSVDPVEGVWRRFLRCLSSMMGG